MLQPAGSASLAGVAVFLFFYLVNESLFLLCLYVGWSLAPSGDVKQFVQLWLDSQGDLKEFVLRRWMFLGAGAVIFAAFRVSFHPTYRGNTAHGWNARRGPSLNRCPWRRST